MDVRAENESCTCMPDRSIEADLPSLPTLTTLSFYRMDVRAENESCTCMPDRSVEVDTPHLPLSFSAHNQLLEYNNRQMEEDIPLNRSPYLSPTLKSRQTDEGRCTPLNITALESRQTENNTLLNITALIKSRQTDEDALINRSPYLTYSPLSPTLKSRQDDEHHELEMCTLSPHTSPRFRITVYERQSLVIERLLTESFKSHPSLQGFESNIDSSVSMLYGMLNEYQLASFITLTHHGTSLGRYALTHNDIVDSCVIELDMACLSSEAMKDWKSSLPEVFSNSDIAGDEREVIEDKYMIDFETVLSMINSRSGWVEGRPLIPSPASSSCNLTSSTGVQSVYQEYRELICAINDDVDFTSHCPPEYVIALDYEKGSFVPSIFRIALKDLIISIIPHGGTAVNPVTGKSWDIHILKQLRERYRKEMAIYRYFLNHNPSMSDR